MHVIDNDIHSRLIRVRADSPIIQACTCWQTIAWISQFVRLKNEADHPSSHVGTAAPQDILGRDVAAYLESTFVLVHCA